MKKIAALLTLVLTLLPLSALAQTGSVKTQAQLNTEIGTTGCAQPICLYPDQNLGQITPFFLRQGLLDITATMFGSQLTVGTSGILSGSSNSVSYGLLFNKNGVLGDSNKDTSLSNGITGPPITISSNAAPLPALAGSIGGGVPPLLRLGTADEGETILSLASFGTNSNSTLSLGKARGTAAAPLPLLNADIIGIIVANGWQASSVLGGTSASGWIEFRATEDWTPAANGTSLNIFLQPNGTSANTQSSALVYTAQATSLNGGNIITYNNSLGTVQATGLQTVNQTAAAAGAQQQSPSVVLSGQGWKTNATAASQQVDFALTNLPVQGAVSPTGTLVFGAQVNGGGYTRAASILSSGLVDAAAGFSVAGGTLGLSATVTVRAAGGGSDCTLIFTGGIKTGGSC